MKFMRRVSVMATTTLALSISAAAATTTTTGSDNSTATSSVAAATHTIQVGVAGFVFTPNVTTADVGDTIQFNFYPTNHSVSRAAYKYPCIPYNYVYVDQPNFWSGFQPVQAILNPPPSYSVVVNDTDPIFFYCTVPGACLDDIMIGVINPNETETLATQAEFVKNSTLELSPGEAFPTESPKPDPTASGGYDSPTSSSTTSTSSTGAATSSSGGGTHLSGGAIAGIAIGGAAVVILAATLLYICGRKGGIEKGYRRSGIHGPGGPPAVEAKYNTPGSPPPERGFTPSPFGQPGSEMYNRAGAASPQWGQSVESRHTSYQQGFASPRSTDFPLISPQLDQSHLPYYDAPKPATPPPQPPAELPTHQHDERGELPGYQVPRT